jgi:hypothetical protein
LKDEALKEFDFPLLETLSIEDNQLEDLEGLMEVLEEKDIYVLILNDNKFTYEVKDVFERLPSL